jgi:hypothetical protein
MLSCVKRDGTTGGFQVTTGELDPKQKEILRRTIVECSTIDTVVECVEEDTQFKRSVWGANGARDEWSQLGIIYRVLVGVNRA